jgi:hypothetical protein
MIKRNYYGLKNGEYLGYNAGRSEKYFYCIFADGSECVQIEKENGERYIFVNIAYCKKMHRLGHSFKHEGLTNNFKKALCA